MLIYTAFHTNNWTNIMVIKRSGDTDGRVPVLSTRYSLSSLGLPIKTSWRPWYHQKQARNCNHCPCIYNHPIQQNMCLKHIYKYRLVGGFKSTRGLHLRHSEEQGMLSRSSNPARLLPSSLRFSKANPRLPTDELMKLLHQFCLTNFVCELYLYC